jgi:hypothetical protein
MLVTTNTTYSFVDTEGFRCYMSCVAPNFTVKGRHSMSRELTPLLTGNVQAALDEVLCNELLHCENVAFTTDKWQSKAEQPYMSLTIHYVSSKFVLKKYVIACKSTKSLNEAAKSALIESLIADIKGLKPKERCARTMVYDCRMNKRIKQSGSADYQLNCIDHMINNALKPALGHKDLAPLVQTVNELVKAYTGL